MSNEEFIASMLTAVGLGGVGGGAAMLLKHRLAPATVWYELDWPRQIDPDGVTSFLRSVAGDRRQRLTVFEVVGRGGHLRYRVGLADSSASGVLSQLRSFVPGVAIEQMGHDVATAPGYAWELTVSSAQRPLRDNSATEIAKAIVTALSGSGETTVILQMLLGTRRSPAAVSPRATQPVKGLRGGLRLLVSAPAALGASERRALQAKIGDAGFRASARIGVGGTTLAGAQLVAARLLAALRQAEGPGVKLGLRRIPADPVASAAAPRGFRAALNVGELTGLLGWPLGDGDYPGVRRQRATRLRSNQPRVGRGRTVLMSDYPGEAKRPLVLEGADALHHLHVVGPTGVGKSTLLLNLITQDIAAGRGCVVIDPKGDLVDDVLARIPETRRDDVVVLDPTDAIAPVGLNVLATNGRSPELVADQVLSVFHHLYNEHWGPRTQDVLHASLLTLARSPGMTICALPSLLTDARFRQRIVMQQATDIGLTPFWQWFEALSGAERQQVIAPALSRLRPFLLRPSLRTVLGQATPKFQLAHVFTKRTVLLVSLAKGSLGPEGAALFGALVVSQLWQAILGRVRVPAGRRRPVSVYLDEFQDYTKLPTDIGDALAQARGLGAALTVAHQHLGQLTPSLRSGVLANARSRVCFQLAPEDARTIAYGHPELQPEDLQGLGRFEAYASLVHQGTVLPFASGTSSTPRGACSEPAELRQLSRTAYGQLRSEIEAELSRLIGGEDEPTGTLGRRRRT